MLLGDQGSKIKKKNEFKCSRQSILQSCFREWGSLEGRLIQEEVEFRVMADTFGFWHRPGSKVRERDQVGWDVIVGFPSRCTNLDKSLQRRVESASSQSCQGGAGDLVGAASGEPRAEGLEGGPGQQQRGHKGEA